ncbi:DNA-binding protein [Cloacibacillus porcorum]|uniref:sigma factor-like helix-turn-helix DNA-binding protein n=1 Tax=Cloacibacillus porcorum TaxID=1197717 RepID=UPI001459E5CB|nr:sigma factor-like helix-turn-helix DNA-binding protein [Cloacibacillus porcorum]MCC8185841.1 DNA-binding protein [Cloacibacillus porcorum]MCD7876593.1 DNA-binding protein [Cloacibacillus porcorum]MCI5866151.1 DNA-binding protein [Cloacibacillus porcorum]MDD7649993.1 sigma factor-like helix-turn-helix DNA-binding protein [Cloacibacillus porcorum]MDY4093352.1 sigma factor-like helix-turn-helix DNA-binding protein [Cloacibacillus porcorum]
MAEKDSLNQRVRDGLLLDNYGAQLTEKQRMACEMILMQDLSLSEAAETLGVSRQGVHDLITRAREHMEEYEKSFGLIARRQQMEQVLEENRERLPEDFYATFKKILGA